MRSRLGLCLYAAVLAFMILRIPILGDPMGSDAAWNAMLALDWQSNARFGVDTVFTCGPAGFPTMTLSWLLPDLVWPHLVGQVATAVVVAGSLTAVTPHLPNTAVRAAYLVILLILAPWPSDQFFGATAALSTVLLVTRARWPALLLTLVAMSAIAAVKFTHFAHTALVIAALASARLLVGRFGAALGVFAGYTAVLGVLWLAFGQSIADLPAYVRGSIEIASGYNDTMSARGPRADLLLALGAAGSICVQIACMVLAPRKPLLLLATTKGPGFGDPATTRDITIPVRLAAAAIVAATLFVTWKAAFVRHDPIHALVFFHVAAIAPFLVAAVGRERAWPRLSALAAAVAVAIGIGTEVWSCQRLGLDLPWAVRDVKNKAKAIERGSFVETVAAWHAAKAAEFALPRTQAKVGAAEIDLMGYEQGVLVVNGLRVRHRPVCQSYHAYTQYLQRINGEFFASDRAPRFVLVKVQSAGGHPPMAEDSAAWKVLLLHYVPVLSERDFLLLERRAADAATPPRTVVIDRRVELGEWIELPPGGADLHELSIDAAYSPLGKVVRALFCAKELILELRTKDAVREYCIAPCLVQESFICDPLVCSAADLLTLYLGQPLPRVSAFRVLPAPGGATHYEPTIGIRVSRCALPHLGDADSRALQGVRDQASFPGFDVFPSGVEPPAHVHPGTDRGVPCVLTLAPAKLSFDVARGAHRLRAEFVMLAGSYTNGGATHGVTFKVVVGRGAQARVVFDRRLDPLRKPEDRAVQTLRVDLDLSEPDVVALVTDNDPAKRAIWDWSAWRSVQIEPK